ncbi:hypothetical protein KO465_02120 [Candidatus Micrarchaeota archaeon]|jgi:hypothetical protein|nr:hypothetical protein [Candidatus Micrarchaeota archaeon]
MLVLTDLWSKNTEIEFFRKSLDLAVPEQLFYITNDKKYFAYWPLDYRGDKTTLQSRNALIGNFTEKWSTDIIQQIIENDKLYAVKGAICDELALTRQSPGDVVISKKNGVEQRPEDIIVIFEVKMSIVWNWEYIKENQTHGHLKCIGDYKTHSGNPGLLRSDSMLKAIGKSVNIRISSPKASRIPIIILGNTPITKNYYKKVDQLYKAGIIQGFWSLNPSPLDCNNSRENIKTTQEGGFFRFDNLEDLQNRIRLLYSHEAIFLSCMKNKTELGKIIETVNKQKTYEEKGELFIRLIGE